VKNPKEATSVSDENHNEEVIIKASQEEMIVAFDTIRRGSELQENIIDDVFQSLQIVHIFIKIVFFTINLYKAELQSLL